MQTYSWRLSVKKGILKEIPEKGIPVWYAGGAFIFMHQESPASPSAQQSIPIRTIYISSYVPRRCGIATFTKDLTTAMSLNTQTLVEIMAVLDDIDYLYPWEVKTRIAQHSLSDYIEAARYINRSSTTIVNLQHEFGLYGGEDGEYILSLIDALERPLVTTFHTILPEPDDHKAYIMRRIIARSAAIVAMTNESLQTLIARYDCPPEKIVLINHGVPDFSFNGMKLHKKKLGVTAAPMILTAGLLGPGKGLEFVLDAMPNILSKLPKAQLYIVGQTHPHIIKKEGEVYRESLEERARKLGIAQAVTFVNKYLEDDELHCYFSASDFFVTAYPNLQQPTSGTLAWGIASGKVNIATPYQHAREALQDGSGILIKPNDSDSIADAVISSWSHKADMETMMHKAYTKGREMTWPSVGRQYLDLFRAVTEGGTV